MKQFNVKAFLALFASIVCGLANAANLSVPEHLQVVTINGEEQQWYLLMDKEDYQLKQGINSISVRYRDLIESDYDDTHQTVTSEPVSLTFSAEQGQTYTLTAPRPENEADAQAFAKKPQITITQQDQQVALLKPIYTAVAQAAPTTATEHPVKPATDPSAADQAQTPAGQMLRYWWQQADPATRQAFLDELAGQAN